VYVCVCVCFCSEVQAQLARLPPALLPPATQAPRGGDGGGGHHHMDGLRLMALLLDQVRAGIWDGGGSGAQGMVGSV